MKPINMNKYVKVFAPATIGNVSCGFDVLGLCVSHPGDIVSVRLTNESGVSIKKITGDGGKLPLKSDENTASVAVMEYLHSMDIQIGVEIDIKKGLPLAGGMGASGASAVGALYALNHLLGNPLTPKEMLPFALKAEEVACGSPHADNVAPGLLGGLVLIKNHNPVDIITLPFPDDVSIVLLHPKTMVKTEQARKIIPLNIPLKDAIAQMANIATFVSGVYEKDYSKMAKGITDLIAEPVRKKMIPYFEEVKKISVENGAFGFGISGSGPTMFAFVSDLVAGERIVSKVEGLFIKKGMSIDTYITNVNNVGPQIIGEE